MGESGGGGGGHAEAPAEGLGSIGDEWSATETLVGSLTERSPCITSRSGYFRCQVVSPGGEKHCIRLGKGRYVVLIRVYVQLNSDRALQRYFELRESIVCCAGKV